MRRLNRLHILALCSLLALPLITAGCSKSGGGSPTEPALVAVDSAASSGSVASVSGEARGRGRGGDDNNANDDRRGRGRGGRNGDRDDDRPRNQAGREFEGAVTAVDGNTLRLAGGLVVTVDGQTQWNARGDLFSLADVAESLADRRSPRVEGRGTRQANGTILARTIKGEHIGD